MEKSAAAPLASPPVRMMVMMAFVLVLVPLKVADAKLMVPAESLSLMVTVAGMFAPSCAPPVGLDSHTRNVNGPVTRGSRRIGTVKVLERTFVGNTSTPLLVAMKLTRLVAVTSVSE